MLAKLCVDTYTKILPVISFDHPIDTRNQATTKDKLDFYRLPQWWRTISHLIDCLRHLTAKSLTFLSGYIQSSNSRAVSWSTGGHDCNNTCICNINNKNTHRHARSSLINLACIGVAPPWLVTQQPFACGMKIWRGATPMQVKWIKFDQ